MKDAVKNCTKSFVILWYLKSVGIKLLCASQFSWEFSLNAIMEWSMLFSQLLFHLLIWTLLKSNLFRRRRKRHFFFQRWIVAIKNKKKCQGKMRWQNILLIGTSFDNDELDSLIVMDKYEDMLWISKAL